MPDASGDHVVLSLPAAPEFVNIARLTCAGLATRLGMTYDEVEDTRIAVGEACALLIGSGDRIGQLVLTCEVLADSLQVEIRGAEARSVPGPVSTEGIEMSHHILKAVVDEHRVELDLDRVWLAKRVGETEQPAAGGPSAGGPEAG